MNYACNLKFTEATNSLNDCKHHPKPFELGNIGKSDLRTYKA